jgi:hypothetical protein
MERILTGIVPHPDLLSLRRLKPLCPGKIPPTIIFSKPILLSGGIIAQFQLKSSFPEIFYTSLMSVIGERRVTGGKSRNASGPEG